jgi:hypothetical protein
MGRLTWVLVIFFVSLHAPVFGEPANDPSAEEATIVLEGTTVAYAGKITDRNIERFMDTVKGKKVSTLVISSSGGEINEGMEMGEWVFDNHVDVVVERMCMSSCANYVFTAGRQKTIRANSIVAWHGSILQKSGMSDADVRAAATKAYDQLPDGEKRKIDLEDFVKQTIQRMREYQVNSTTRQAQFFRKIGVEEYVCRVGNEKYGAKDFFLLSVRDMAQFGILNVQAPENYEEIDLTPFRQKGKSVEFIHLD